MADDEEELKLPPKFISVHPLAAKKGSHYSCVICSSDGAFLCKLCRSCYCCREHLLLDDLACHAILCERQAAILEILSLPLATRARPETANRLFALRDECRRVAYLESRRHVLEGHHELALPAAERSLHFAREVHGQNSVDLVPPLLALADVATVAGAKEAIGYVSRAAFLVQEEMQRLRSNLTAPLTLKIKQNLANLEKTNPDHINELFIEEKHRKEKYLQWSPQKSPQNNTNTLTQKPLSLKPLFQQCLELMTENSIRDEVFRAKGGASLAFLTSKFWSSNTKILVYEEKYEEALKSASIALYFATLSCGVKSLQTALAIYQLAHLGQLSEKFTEAQQIAALQESQNILKNALLNYYSPLTIQIEQLINDRKLQFSYDSKQLATLVKDYNEAESMREEDRLSFRADVKEAIQRAVYSIQIFEKHYGNRSAVYCECVLLIGIALSCTQDAECEKWDQQGRPCCQRLQELDKDGLAVEHATLMCHIYRVLFAW
ncbi:Conserved_hypothetical protein [Hexamita inflata]|uniref:Uncharacterized protein n=1 Tax=Hexamita inflata TaxID=28002 RepID=A0AA86PGZ0_9EUKA|nr:Conserved hypothetical protein [Hexamita inflata]